MTFIRCGSKLFTVESVHTIDLDGPDGAAVVDTAGRTLSWSGREAQALRDFFAGKGARRRVNVPGLGHVLDLTPGGGPARPQGRPEAPAVAPTGPAPATRQGSPQGPDNGHRKQRHDWGPRAAAAAPAADPGAPRTGRGLYAWGREQDDGGRTLEFLAAYGRRAGFVARMVDWLPADVAQAHAAAVSRMRDQEPGD